MVRRLTALIAAALLAAGAAAAGCRQQQSPPAASRSAPARLVASRPAPARLAVIADPHVDRSGEYRWGGVEPKAGLEAAVRQVNALRPPPAEVVVLGDLARAGQPEDYQAYRKTISSLKVGTVRHLLGNHDEYAPFRQVVLKGTSGPPPGEGITRYHYAWDFGDHWRCIALDSRGRYVAGKITPEQTAWFEAQAAAAGDRNVLVFMHHDPTRIGMTGIRDSGKFLKAVDRHPNVRAIVFGHRHQLEFRTRGRVHLVSSPPTSWPFQREDPRGWLLLTPAAKSLSVEFVPLTAEEPRERFTVTLTWE